MATERQEQIVRNIVKFSAFLGDPEQLARLLDAAKSAKMANIVITRPESEGGIDLPLYVLGQAGYKVLLGTDGLRGIVEYVHKKNGPSIDAWLASTLAAIALFSEKMYRGLDVVDVLFLKKIG